MPTLQALTQEWTTTTAVTHAAATYGAFPAIHASQYYPQAYDVNGNVTDVRTLAEILRARGYSTGGFVASNPYLDRWQEPFDTFWNGGVTDGSTSTFGAAARKAGRLLDFALMRDKVSASDLLERAFTWWGGAEPPRFLWLHVMDVHEPYLPTLRGLSRPHTAHYDTLKFFRNRWSLDERTTRRIKRLYDDCVGYLDEQLQGLDRFLTDDPIVVMTGDHGEAFGHGLVGHAQLYDETITVPYLSTLDRPGDGPIRHLDVAPTILDAVGASMPEQWEGEPTDGRYEESFAMNMSPNLGETHVCVRTNEYKLIRRFDADTGSEVDTELYDLDADPGEQRRIETTGAGTQAELGGRIDEFLARADIDWAALNCREMEVTSPAVEERLKDLGYM
jgi:arylsulfatase A-like enzyme